MADYRRVILPNGETKLYPAEMTREQILADFDSSRSLPEKALGAVKGGADALWNTAKFQAKAIAEGVNPPGAKWDSVEQVARNLGDLSGSALNSMPLTFFARNAVAGAGGALASALGRDYAQTHAAINKALSFNTGQFKDPIAAIGEKIGEAALSSGEGIAKNTVKPGGGKLDAALHAAAVTGPTAALFLAPGAAAYAAKRAGKPKPVQQKVNINEPEPVAADLALPAAKPSAKPEPVSQPYKSTKESVQAAAKEPMTQEQVSDLYDLGAGGLWNPKMTVADYYKIKSQSHDNARLLQEGWVVNNGMLVSPTGRSKKATPLQQAQWDMLQARAGPQRGEPVPGGEMWPMGQPPGPALPAPALKALPAPAPPVEPTYVNPAGVASMNLSDVSIDGALSRIDAAEAQGLLTPMDAIRQRSDIIAGRQQSREGTPPPAPAPKALPAPPVDIYVNPAGGASRQMMDVNADARLSRINAAERAGQIPPEVAMEMRAEVLTGPRQTSAVTPAMLNEAAINIAKPKRKGKKKATLDHPEAGGVSLDIFHPLYRGAKNVYDLFGIAVNPFIKKSVSAIRDIGTKTSSALADMLVHEPWTGGVRQATYESAQSAAAGKYLSQLAKYFDALPGRRFGRNALSEDVNTRLRTGLITGIVDADLAQQALGIRNALNDFHAYAEPVTGIAFRKNFFPAVFNKDKVAVHKDAFIKDLVTIKGMSHAAATNLYNRIVLGVSDMRGVVQGGTYQDRYARRVMHEGGAVKPGSERHRNEAFNIEEGLDKWLITDVPTALSQYIHDMTVRVEMARLLGPQEQKLKAMIEDIIVESSKSDNPLPPNVISDRVYGVIDDIVGVGRHQIQNPLAAATIRAVLNAEVVLHLAKSALSSAHEGWAVASAAGRDAPLAYGRAMSAAVVDGARWLDRKITGSSNIQRTKWREAADDLGVTGHLVMQEYANAYAGASTLLAEAVLKPQTILTTYQRVALASSYWPKLYRMVMDSRTGTGNKKARADQWLGQYFTPEGIVEANAWVDAGMPMNQRPASVNQGGASYVYDFSANPSALRKPLLNNMQHLSMLMQFTSTVAVITNTFWKNQALKVRYGIGLKGKTEHIPGLIAMAATAYAIILLKHQLFNNDKKNEDKDVSTFSKSMDIAEAMAMVPQPAQRIHGAIKYSNNADKAITNLLGVTMSDLINGISIGYKKDKTKAAAKFSARMTPIANAYGPWRDETADFYYDLYKGD